MGKFIRTILFFFLFFGAVVWALNDWMGKNNNEPEHYRKQFEEVVHRTFDADGIIIGNSHAVHGIRPSILDRTGIRFYNLSLNGSNPSYYLHWYEEFFLRHYRKPKYVIYAVDFFSFSYKMSYRTLEDDSEYLPFVDVTRLMLLPGKFNAEKIIMNRFPLLKNGKAVIERKKKLHQDTFWRPEQYDRGFAAYETPVEASSFLVPHLPAELIDEAKEINAFNLLIDRIIADGTKVIFVVLPENGIAKDEYASSTAIAHFQKVAAKHRIPMLNFNTALRSGLNEDRSNFNDWVHLNPKGSKAFSEMLADALEGILGK
jgi:lysophospholipase L1-like esterase